MTATATRVSPKRTSGRSTWRATSNARRSSKLGRRTHQTNCNNIFRWYRSGWGRYTQADPIGLVAGSNLYSYVEGNPLNYIDPLGLISQSQLDEMDCCQMLKAINDARKELLRLRKNQNNPGKLKAANAAEYVAKYLGHKKSWNNWQKRLNDLLGEFNNKNCDPQTLPNQVQQLSDEPYPDMPTGDFLDHWGQGMKQTLDDIGNFMNDPRNWLALLLATRGGGRMPIRVP